jgi:hypothetical protein
MIGRKRNNNEFTVTGSLKEERNGENVKQVGTYPLWLKERILGYLMNHSFQLHGTSVLHIGASTQIMKFCYRFLWMIFFLRLRFLTVCIQI